MFAIAAQQIDHYAGAIKWISIGLIVLALAVAAQALPVRQVVEASGVWINQLGLWGPLVYGLLYIVAVVLFVPGSIPTIGAGAIFGLGIGVITVSLASTIGAMLAFLIARYVARDKVAQLAQRNPKFDAIDRAVGEGGWKIVALLRLSPAVPFNLQNYLYGLTPIRFWPCFFATWLGMLPGTFLYVYIGHVAGAAVAGERERTIWEWGMLAAGLIATVVVTVYITVLARNKLREQTELSEKSKSAQKTPAADRPGADRAAPERPPRRWSALAAATVALLAICLAGYAQMRAQMLRSYFADLLGPPPAKLQEAYAEQRDGPTVDHSAFADLLQKHVAAGGWVDYRGLQEDEEKLDAYLDAVAGAPFEELGRDEKLALLINAYNAFTLKLILDHYPVESIKDIPPQQRWQEQRWQVGGHAWSLNQIEHEQIRPKFREPRIHFALVCAAVGCPPLRREAYVGARIDDQLEDQTRYVHNHRRWVRFDADHRRLHLTELYRWYGGDFEQVADSVLHYVARYVPAVERQLQTGRDVSIEWISYDWSLNSRENMP